MAQGRARKDDTGEAAERMHVRRDLVWGAEELGQYLEGSERPCNMIFTF